jgi:hypothetical protein
MKQNDVLTDSEGQQWIVCDSQSQVDLFGNEWIEWVRIKPLTESAPAYDGSAFDVTLTGELG